MDALSLRILIDREFTGNISLPDIRWPGALEIYLAYRR
jgi:hypothetical protein